MGLGHQMAPLLSELVQSRAVLQTGQELQVTVKLLDLLNKLCDTPPFRHLQAVADFVLLVSAVF